jgi:hypothetical protein
MWTGSHSRISPGASRPIQKKFSHRAGSHAIQKKVLPPGRLAFLDFLGGRTFFCMGRLALKDFSSGRTFFMWDGLRIGISPVSKDKKCYGNSGYRHSSYQSPSFYVISNFCRKARDSYTRIKSRMA